LGASGWNIVLNAREAVRQYGFETEGVEHPCIFVANTAVNGNNTHGTTQRVTKMKFVL
jgi:hypothetical protein